MARKRFFKGEKHGEVDPLIECINKVFRVCSENFFNSLNTRAGKRLSEKMEKW